jgi:hypothetical protein
MSSGVIMANIWKQFESLLDKPATQIATIKETDDTTSKVELLSGDSLRVIGVGAIDSKVYIKDGEIIQQAGSLVQHDMVLY